MMRIKGAALGGHYFPDVARILKHGEEMEVLPADQERAARGIELGHFELVAFEEDPEADAPADPDAPAKRRPGRPRKDSVTPPAPETTEGDANGSPDVSTSVP